ncbi:MAG: exodeoxyribonuclease III [Lachnospiraceae bacterium]|nr:exodeoxyribonuclease III [Lachnospiraceae bacterium]
MKMISWNVNGLRAAVGKGFLDFFKQVDADLFSVQETKLQEGQISLDLEGYHQYWNYAVKKGYSGVAVFSKKEPISVTYGLGIEEHDQEGRVITLEFDDFYYVTAYVPNSQDKNARLDYRVTWEDAMRAYLLELDKKKPVIFCGDLNVAHEEIDLKNPKPNIGNAGFTYEEREKFTELLESGFVDSFRYFYPDLQGAYSWWSYRFSARKNNAGWRIDYFVVSERIKEKMTGASIHSDVMGSDHCPVVLTMEF